MAGYMDKLPSSYKQKKVRLGTVFRHTSKLNYELFFRLSFQSSVFKGWKKRHFKAFDGQLFYFEVKINAYVMVTSPSRHACHVTSHHVTVSFSFNENENRLPE